MEGFEKFLQDYYDGKLELGVFTSKNEKGNDMVVTIGNECLEVKTLQDNGWMKVMTYHKDHTIEETYER